MNLGSFIKQQKDHSEDIYLPAPLFLGRFKFLDGHIQGE